MVLAAGSTDAVSLAGAILRAVWAEDRDIADRNTLLAIAGECNLDAEGLMTMAELDTVAQQRVTESEEAIERGVFGAPTYLFKGEPFWGQDRLDFLERAIKGET